MKGKAKLEVRVSAKEDGFRLDKFLKKRFPEWGRNAIKKLVNSKKIEINGKQVWLGSWKLNKNDLVKFYAIPQSKPKGYQKFDREWIIFEDDELVVVNKPAGLRSQASRAGGKDNLLDLAREVWRDVTLFHRLDRDTSGLILLTKTRKMNQYLDAAIKSNSLEKTYLAVTSSKEKVDTTGVIINRIGDHPDRKDMRAVVEKGGQRAVTRYEMISEESGMVLLSVRIETGRMHQIRVHLRSIGMPILGDILYGDEKKKYARMYLHAAKLILPEADGMPHREFICHPGEDFKEGLPEQLKRAVTKI